MSSCLTFNIGIRGIATFSGLDVVDKRNQIFHCSSTSAIINNPFSSENNVEKANATALLVQNLVSNPVCLMSTMTHYRYYCSKTAQCKFFRVTEFQGHDIVHELFELWDSLQASNVLCYTKRVGIFIYKKDCGHKQE
jgi:cellulase/cellobiase CelA1